jgi:lipoteichoic acid synthase
VSTGLALFLFLVLIRARVTGHSWTWILRPVEQVPRVFLGSYYDFLYVAVLMLVFVGLAGCFRSKPRVLGWLGAGYRGVAIFSFAAAAANIPFVSLIGRPFNYQWLYYSDFLQSFDARHAILANVTIVNVVAALVACLALGTVAIATGAVLDRLLARAKARRWPVLLAVAASGVYLLAGHDYVTRSDRPRGLHENSVVAFVGSFLARNRQPGIFTMKTRFGVEEFMPIRGRPEKVPEPKRRIDDAVRNVVMIVLESVAAQYVEPFGGEFSVTPTLTRFRDRSALFSRVYAHAPHSNTSLWSLQSGLYPWITYRFVARDYPRIEVPSLSGELERRGYRTAFFNSSDNRFQNTEEFLEHQGFDRIVDWRSMRSEQPLLKVEEEGWPYQDGIDDATTMNHVVGWIDEVPGEPFFALMWTMMTHYPYFEMGESETYTTDDESFNRYLNGLRYTDAAIGKLLEALESRGLSHQTLVVVVGDHGEGFYQHGVGGHGRDLYEESVRVPLQLINPGLFRGETHDVLGGLVDVPATILDILGVPAPETWQGRSLFDSHRRERVYFFAPTSDYWFGYREGDRKYLYNASRDEVEVYDLASDAGERVNLAKNDPASEAQCKERLASWVQYQNRTIERLLEGLTR